MEDINTLHEIIVEQRGGGGFNLKPSQLIILSEHRFLLFNYKVSNK